MRNLFLSAVILSTFSANAENFYNTKDLGTCEVLELGSQADFYTWVNEDEEGIERGIGIDVNHRDHSGNFIFSGKHMKVKDKDKSFTLKLSKPLLGVGFNSGKVKIDKKTGEGTLNYTDRCWDWGGCGVFRYSYNLTNCHLDYDWEIPSGHPNRH